MHVPPMLNHRAWIAAAILVFCSFAGLASAQTPPPTMTLDAGANGGSTVIALGTVFAIALPENPSTGYTWQLQPLALPVVGEIGNHFAPATGDAMLGAGGRRIITFAALSPGTALLVLQRQRSGEEPAPGETFSVTITVAAPAE